MKLTLVNMAEPGLSHIRVDIYLNDEYVGEIRLSPEEWVDLEAANDNGGLEVVT